MTNASKVKETLMGILFILAVSVTGIQPANSREAPLIWDNRGAQCELIDLDDSEWYLDQQPRSKFITYKLSNNAKVDMVYGLDKVELWAEPSSSFDNYDIPGVSEIEEIYKVSFPKVDMHLIGYNDFGGHYNTMMLFVSYQGRSPSYLYQYFSCDFF